MRKGQGNLKKIIVECIKKEKERTEGEESKWKAIRRVLLKKIGIEKEEIKKKKEEGNEEIVKTVLEKIWVKEKEERQKLIRESRYNSMYKDITTEELPKYLRRKKKGKDRCLIARYRCGNEMKGSQH